MMKKILPDMLMLGLVLTVVLCLAADQSPRFSSPPQDLEPLAVRTDSAAKSPWHPPVSRCNALKERNLFLASEKYASRLGKSSIPLSQEPYLLEAILLGQEEQAIFRQNSGELLVLTTGQALVDGAVLVEISPRSVKLKKGGEIVTMMLFDIQVNRSVSLAGVKEKQH